MVISDDDEEDEDGEDEEEYSEDDQVDQSEDAAATSSAAAAPAVPFNPYSCGLYHASIITDLTAIVSSPYDFESALHGWLQHLDSMVVGPFFSCWCSQITTHSYGAARRHIRAVHGSLPPDEIDQRQNSDDVELVKASEQQEQEAEEEEDVEMQTEEEQKKRGAMPSRHTIGSKHIELPPPPPRSPVRGFPTRKRARSI
jgi:hypothetical protein